MSDALKTPLGAIAPPWIPVLDAPEWIERWFGVRPPNEWMHDLFSMIMAADPLVQYRVQGLDATVVAVRMFAPAQPDPNTPWFKKSPYDADQIILSSWDQPEFDPETFTVAGPRQPDGRLKRHPIEVRSIDIKRRWLDHQQGHPGPDVEQTGTTSRANPGRRGSPPRHDWNAFGRALARYAALNGLEPEYRREVQRHMEAWTAEHWVNPPTSLDDPNLSEATI
jgi:hypothetical protein